MGTDLNFKERLFCVISYIPKATVQAAIGTVPLEARVQGEDIILAVGRPFYTSYSTFSVQ